jgi:hypothetical protein
MLILFSHAKADIIYCKFWCFSWHIILRMRVPEEGPCDPIAPLDLPHSLHAFHRVSSSDSLNMVVHSFYCNFFCYELCLLEKMTCTITIKGIWLMDLIQSFHDHSWLLQEGYHTFRGGFWNYFSMGKASMLFSSLLLHKCGKTIMYLYYPVVYLYFLSWYVILGSSSCYKG